MPDITRLEEQILLSVWQLKEEAYGATIYELIVKKTGKDIAIGGIYFPLERMVRRGFLEAVKGEPTPVRGGQSKRYYHLTKAGLELLKETRKTYDSFWENLPDDGLIREK